MKSVNYEELNLVLDQLCEKRDDIQDQIDNNALMISELDSSDSLLYGEGDDFDLFSPRKKAGSRYKKEKLMQDRSMYQEENNKLFLERNKMNLLIETLQRVLNAESAADAETFDSEESNEMQKDDSRNNDSEKADIPSDEKTDSQRKSRKKSPAQDLSRIVRKVEQTKKFIDQDPRRAKMELDAICKKLNKVMENVSREN